MKKSEELNINEFWQIQLQGNTYIFGGIDLSHDGFIATEEQYKNGLPSYAHYYPNDNGFISRYGNKIGTKEDIAIVGKIEVIPTNEGFMNIFEALFGEDFDDSY